MSEKTRILDSLNEQALLLPSLVNRALAANDRVKYRFTLLQAAQAHAERPDSERTQRPVEPTTIRYSCRGGYTINFWIGWGESAFTNTKETFR
jgi:hypothetical protein